jgi:LPXTG-site transpeptidase (sortase) family protein
LYSAWTTSSLDDLIIEERSSLENLFPTKSEIHISNASNPNNLSQQITLPADLDAYLEEFVLIHDGKRHPLEAYNNPYVVAPDPALTTKNPFTGAIASSGTVEQAPYLEGFYAIDWSMLPRNGRGLVQPNRIEIPAIKLDSQIDQVEANWVGDRLLWDIPRNVVGYHKGTAQPGTFGNTILSGHISSPVKREGSVFKDLPAIAPLLIEGQPVDVILHTVDARYLYRIIKTDVAEPENVDLFRPITEPSVTLITCIPDYIYTHRFLVTGILIGKAAL